MVSEGNSINNWVRFQSSDISAQNGTAFCPSIENVSNEKLKKKWSDILGKTDFKTA